MKISFVISLAVLFCSFTEKAVSQNARVSINARNVSVSELLTRIESQTDYLFVYSKNNVDVNRRVTIRTKEEPVARVLNEVFRDTDVRYAMEGTHIVLVPKSRVGEKDDLPAIERVQQIFVSGTVVDMAGDPLPGVNVTIKGTTTGTVTGIDGQYRISIPDRDVTLSYSFVGYITQDVDLGAEASQSVALVNVPQTDNNSGEVKPQSGINFVLYNSRMEVVEENTGVLLVEDRINEIQTLASDNLIMQEAGFLEVYINNEAQTPVYYDNFTVAATTSNVVEINAYYPYGMIIPALSLMAPPDKWNGYKYSAKELETALNLGVYDFGRRMYDPVAPRFWTPDRFAEKYPWLSPYNYAANNPVLYIDPTGDTITLSNIFMENKQVMKSYNEWATSKAGKQFISDYGAGGKYGKVSVVFDLVDFKDGTSGRTEMFGVDKKTGKETELTPSRTIEELKERGVDVSGYRSSLNKNEYLRAKISVSGNLIDAYSIKQGGTMVHETQHVRLMYKNILDVGYIFHSGKDQHWYMKQEDSRWFRERYQYWQEKRPNYTRKEIFPLMNQFEW